jgi:hypothetical protein
MRLVSSNDSISNSPRFARISQVASKGMSKEASKGTNKAGTVSIARRSTASAALRRA